MKVLELIRQTFAQHWRRIVVQALVAASLTAAIVYLLPESYRSTTIIIPESDKGKLANVMGLSDLAGLAGVTIGGDQSMMRLYPTLAQSEAILVPVITERYTSEKVEQPVDLFEYWEIEHTNPYRKLELALLQLRGDMDVRLETKTGLLTISLAAPEPQLAADILNRIVRQLDSHMRTKRVSNASQQREWIEARLSEVERELAMCEDSLRQFRETNRRVADSPKLVLAQERLARKVQISSTIYIELKKQLEIVKIEEIKNMPIIQVLDAARPSGRRESPKRGSVILGVFLLSVTLLAAIPVFRELQPDTWAKINALTAFFVSWVMPSKPKHHDIG